MNPPSPLKPAVDFASAAMLRVLVQGMREIGLNPEPFAGRAASPVATVSLNDKRGLVGHALSQGGFGCLALLGRGLHRYAHEPTHRALVSARDPRDLLTRWTRLERYIHSRHHIEVQDLSECHARVVHLARPGHPPPFAAEDLVVLGVLVALLEAVLARPVAARIGDVPICPEPDHEAVAALAQQRRTATWTMEWTPAAVASGPRPAPAPFNTDALQAPNLSTPPSWTAHSQRCFATLSKDLMNPLTLTELAHTQGQAPRSLQRELSRAGLSYTAILAQARCHAASWWLLATSTPIAEVGFISGYADQPHFTRDFRKRVGMTPQRYRSEFSAEP